VGGMRVFCLAEWEAEGQPPALKCDPETFRAKGLATSGVKKMRIDTAALKAVK
jgi:hypothetical protein